MLGQLPANLCDRLVAEFKAQGLKDAAMGEGGETTNHGHRNTAVKFAQPGHWFAQYLVEQGHFANRHCGWDYHLTGEECLQFAQYAPGQHYDWHTDTFTLSGNPIERKVTAVCLLSDPSEYEGGEFQMRLYQQYSPPLAKGTIIAFPSILEHRVTPVTKGERLSATVWMNGPRFR
jgi:PKHD-type hydroxylase